MPYIVRWILFCSQKMCKKTQTLFFVFRILIELHRINVMGLNLIPLLICSVAFCTTKYFISFYMGSFIEKEDKSIQFFSIPLLNF